MRMYAAIRPALRSASTARPPARFIRGRRYPSSYHLRSFHSTGCLAQSPNPPPSPDNIPVSDNDAEKRNREKAAMVPEQPDAGVATEDPEILAQKLQRSREMTRRYTSALRRSQRRNRAQDLPPIYIPDWFLDKRVKLREDHPLGPHTYSTKGNNCSVSIAHNESGEYGTCSIPFRGETSMGDLSEIVRAMWRKGMSEDQRKKLARDFARRIVGTGAEVDSAIAKSLERGEALIQDIWKDIQDEGLEETGNKKYAQLAKSFRVSHEELMDMFSEKEKLDIQRRMQELKERKREPEAEEDMKIKQEMDPLGRDAEQKKLKRHPPHISPLILAEIRATIAASLSTVQPALNDSFPSAKTNLILHSPSNEHERTLLGTLDSIYAELGVDVVILEAQDLAQLIGDYIGEGPEPSPHSIRSLGYETYKLSSEFANDIEELGKEDTFEDEQEATGNQSGPPELPPGLPRGVFRIPILAIPPTLNTLNTIRSITQNLRAQQLSGNSQGENVGSSNNQQTRIQTQSESQLEDLKLSTFLEALIDSNEVKRGRGLSKTKSDSQLVTPVSLTKSTNAVKPKFFDYSISEGAEIELSSVLPASARPGFTFSVNVGLSPRPPTLPKKSKVIYIRDIKELSATQYGSRILQKLEDIVHKQRNMGENIMLLGTTCSLDLTPELSPSGVQSIQSEGEAGFFRTIVVPFAPPIEPIHTEDSLFDISSAAKAHVVEQSSSPAEKRKFRDINLRHIQDMLQCLDPGTSINITSREPGVSKVREFSTVFPESYFWRVLTYDEVHRIAVTALGLHIMAPSSIHLNWAHVALAMGLLKASDEVKYSHIRHKAIEQDRNLRVQFKEQMDKIKVSRGHEPLRKGPGLGKQGDEANAASVRRQQDLSRIQMSATKHEKRLMPGIANPDQIKTTFDQIHVPKETVDAIRTLTSLSLLRPDAFDYGVLASEKISGALLYGPPGTGKTLLAKAVAKESGSMVLEVSGSQIMDKYVGEGEKNVAAIFSLARKLSPCIVFLDEADAIFASRNALRERTSHRDILNQFLKEWDGLNDLSVFVMVATNRPFDLDDAVIRRLPRRLLVDLPTEADRKEILKIHLRGEQLDASVDLDDIAKRTPLYSGSDLKNLAVSTALACVKEENEQAAIAAATAAAEAAQLESYDVSAKADSSSKHEAQPQTTNPPQLVRGQKYNFPEKRTLHSRHFDKALQEISASISEDMSSLNAVKKFDEQYGDRKGRRKKNAYGFGIHTEKNESAARVRT